MTMFRPTRCLAARRYSEVVTDAVSLLERGRAALRRAAWHEASLALGEADRAGALSAVDLEALGRVAYMLGDTRAYVAALERAHRAHLEESQVLPAVRVAFWIGHSMLFQGHTVSADGWFARARRLFDEAGEDGAERGWLLIPTWLDHMARGDYESGYAAAGEAVVIAQHFGDDDLLWLARGDQGRALVNLGRVADGLRLVDEMLVVAAEGTLSPVVTGIVYCNTIAYCVDGYAFEHAREWTAALLRWCESQPEMEEHFGFCLVHRAELHHLSGSWAIAQEESERAERTHGRGQLNALVRGKAAYVQGELHRHAGEFAAAETSFRDANALGFEPQPGLALLRLAQGDHDSAAAAIRRVTGEATQPLRRLRLLPAYVEVALAVGELERARAAVEELEGLASTVGGAATAMASCSRGALLLAREEPREALIPLRAGMEAWQRLGVPYEEARGRVLVALACRAVGDHDTAAFELETAGAAFGQLGAEPDRARVATLVGRTGDDGLTSREIEVLGLVSSGRSNGEIAAALHISEHTVARHLQNIFAKLGVTSRTAAAAYAFQHRLV
jgi:DNA-binding CsgD family transcriptional regulator